MRISKFIVVFCMLSVVVWLHVSCNSQGASAGVTKIEIDSLYLHTNQTFRKKGAYEKLIEINFGLIEQSKEIQYDKGIIRSYINIANLLWNLEKNKEALDILNQVKPDVKKANDPSLEAHLYYEYMSNYQSLGLSREATADFYRSLAETENIKDLTDRRRLRQLLFNSIAVKFTDETKEDSALVYFKKAFAEWADALICENIARSFLMLGPQPDSALSYLHTADSLLKTGDYPVYQKAFYFRIRGMYFRTTKQYDAAIHCNLQALEIFTSMKRTESIVANYKSLYEIYTLNGNNKSAKYYLEKYAGLSDSIQLLEKKATDTSISHLLNEAKQKSEHTEQHLLLVIAGIMIITAAGTIVWYKSYKKLYLKNKRKAALLTQKEQETEYLKSKVNDSLDELIDLAKENDPVFYVRFKEAYPYIHRNLLSICPDLKLSELALCAYIYLDFSTKDISEYTFKSVKTIQNRKNSLRKRLNISSGEDLYAWMKDIPQGIEMSVVL